MTRKPLDQRLGGESRLGILRDNSPDAPFWVPEENPALRAWDMALSEYCGAVSRVTGWHSWPDCRQILRKAWPEAGQAVEWTVGLIPLLGRVYRLLYGQDEEYVPDWEHEPCGGGDGTAADLRYIPERDPPLVRYQWNTGPACAPAGDALSPQKAQALERMLFRMTMYPFAVLRKQQNSRRKEEK